MTKFRMTALAAALAALSLSAGAETLTTDIVVVGAGAAGLSAAVNSADHGAKRQRASSTTRLKLLFTT